MLVLTITCLSLADLKLPLQRMSARKESKHALIAGFIIIENMLRIAFGLFLIGALDVFSESPREIFERRIVPIFKSPNPSSCTECHLSGVDLKNYILPSHEQTFVSLRDQGLIDFENPADSKILRLIAMGGDQMDKNGAALISARS